MQGLKIPCEVTVEMEVTDTHTLAIDKYKQLVSDQYQEPVQGKFPDATQEILKAMKSISALYLLECYAYRVIARRSQLRDRP